MNWFYTIGAGILILPSLLIVVVPLLDRVLSSSFVSYLNDINSYLVGYIGTDTLTVLLSCLGIVMFIFFLKWCLRVLGTISR